ncbi:DUF3772 domain-containing protein [Thalassospira profundimaris]|uniref:DUF3772 domain-containing protein n=1 Tax=Thalassospira profundimaris TaxID=502049 RepID=UPI00215D5F65|nr:DUF3772 domain-containing protein [Thalassospira profundimaris]
MNMFRRVLMLVLFGLFMASMSAGLAGGAYAQSNADGHEEANILENSQKTLAHWNKTFDAVEKQLSSSSVSGRELADSRSDLEQAIDATRDLEALAQSKLERLNAALGKLGPKPEGDASEVPAVTVERDRLNKEIARVSGIQKQGELAAFRAGELLDQVGRMSRERFTRRIFSRADVPWDPAVWQKSWAEAMRLPEVVRSRYSDVNLADHIGDRLEDVAPELVFLLFAIAAALIGGEVVIFRFLPVRWRAAKGDDRLALISGIRFTLSAIIPGILLFVFYRIIASQGDLMQGSGGELINQFFFAALFMLFVGASIRSVFSPFAPQMRSAGTTTTGARVVGFAALFAAVIFAFDIVLLQGATTIGASLDLALVQSLSNITLICAVMFVAALGVWWEHDAIDEQQSWWRKVERRCRRVVLFVSVVLPLLSFVGYVALARFVLENMMLALAFATSYWILREFLRALVHIYLVKPDTEKDENATDAVHGTLYFWLRVTIDAMMLAIAVPTAIMVFTDIAWADLIGAVETAFVGIQIGSINFSLRAILIGVLLFLLLLSLMRFFQRMLNTRVLPNTKLDQGLQHSVSAIFGYVGIGLAVLIAVSAAGVDLSNLAIIAGAISVGIGFGMQSIVNNFVSGLILLIERPIKVGDWIVVGADQGFVKDIRVRATEIETFDRSSVVIPNSELISNRVLNWTLKERSGRGIVPIGVSYSADANKVRDILLEMADKRREILSYPAPQVVFIGFGDSSLDFELRYFLRDIGDVLAVASSIRFEVLERFREEGIEIPFPQRDVNLRDIDRLEDAIRSLAGQRSTRSDPVKDKDQDEGGKMPPADSGPGAHLDKSQNTIPSDSSTSEIPGSATPATRELPDADR